MSGRDKLPPPESFGKVTPNGLFGVHVTFGLVRAPKDDADVAEGFAQVAALLREAADMLDASSAEAALCMQAELAERRPS